MGNWAAAFRGAAEGFDTMSKTKLGEAEMVYKEVSERNKERFRKQLQEDQQEFLASESQKQRDWETPFKQKGLDIRERDTELTGELKILSQKSLDTQRSIENQLRAQSNAIAQQRADQAGAETKARSMDDLRDRDADIVQKADEEIRKGTPTFGAIRGDQLERNYALESIKAKSSVYQGEDTAQTYAAREAYDKAYGFLTSKWVIPSGNVADDQKNKLDAAMGEARRLATEFARMPEQVRNEVISEFNAGEQKSPAVLANMIRSKVGGGIPNWGGQTEPAEPEPTEPTASPESTLTPQEEEEDDEQAFVPRSKNNWMAQQIAPGSNQWSDS